MKTITNKIGSFLWMFAASICMLLVQTGCNEDDIPFIGLDNEVIALSSDMAKQTVDVKANVDWTAVSDAEWCKIIKGTGAHKGQFEILVEQNMTPEERIATILVSGKDASANLIVKQAPGNFTMGVSTESVAFGKKADSYLVSVVSNFAWKVVSSNDWCKVSTASGSMSGEFVISVNENNTGKERNAVVSVITEVSGEAFIKNIAVSQASTENFLVLPITEFMLGKEGKDVEILFVAGGTNTLIEPSVNVDWIDNIRLEENKVVLHVNDNATGEAREAEIAVTAINEGAEPIVRTVKLIQTASDFYFVVPVEKMIVSEIEKEYDLEYELMGDNVSVKPTADCEWIEPEIVEGENKLHFKVQNNTSNAVREGNIILTTVGNPGEPIVKTIHIQQNFTNFYFVVPVENMVLSKEEKSYTVDYELKGDGVTVNPSSDSEEWLTAKLVEGKNQVEISLTENKGDAVREGNIILTAVGNPGEPVVKTIHIVQNFTNNILETLVDEVTVAPQGEKVKLPFYSNTEVAVRSGAEWLTVLLDGSDIEISAGENFTSAVRETYVTVTVTAADGQQVSKAIKVSQLPLNAEFAFEQEVYELTYNEFMAYVQLKAYGKWKMVETVLPGWLSLDGTEGENDGTVTVMVKKNYYNTSRSFEVKFENTDLKKETVLKITQQADPNGVNNFSYLGKGYDATGKFVDDSSVKAYVLDQDKLNESGNVLEITNENQIVNKMVVGSTLEEYKMNLSAPLNIADAVNGFSATLNSNFTLHALEQNDNSFATYRHMVKKSTLKLDESLNAKQLTECVSEQFLSDVKSLSAEALVNKYGTHVITGFSKGGALQFSLSVEQMSSVGLLENALEGGFLYYAKGITTGANYELYAKLHCECKLMLSEGGESQYTTSSGSQKMYNSWLSSLDDDSKCVLVDYEGSRMIPLYELIEDSSKQTAVKSYIESLLK